MNVIFVLICPLFCDRRVLALFINDSGLKIKRQMTFLNESVIGREPQSLHALRRICLGASTIHR